MQVKRLDRAVCWCSYASVCACGYECRLIKDWDLYIVVYSVSVYELFTTMSDSILDGLKFSFLQSQYN